MTNWRVEGAEKDSGKPVTRVFVAATKEEAEQTANRYGILVSSAEQEVLPPEDSLSDVIVPYISQHR